MNKCHLKAAVISIKGGEKVTFKADRSVEALKETKQTVQFGGNQNLCFKRGKYRAIFSAHYFCASENLYI